MVGAQTGHQACHLGTLTCVLTLSRECPHLSFTECQAVRRYRTGTTAPLTSQSLKMMGLRFEGTQGHVISKSLQYSPSWRAWQRQLSWGQHRSPGAPVPSWA